MHENITNRTERDINENKIFCEQTWEIIYVQHLSTENTKHKMSSLQFNYTTLFCSVTLCHTVYTLNEDILPRNPCARILSKHMAFQQIMK